MIKVLNLITFLIVSNCLLAQIPAPMQTKSILILGATLHVGDGSIIENSAIAFKNGKIVLVGKAESRNIVQGDYDNVIMANSKHIYPGFIAPNVFLGLQEIEAVRATNDYREAGSINPNARALVAYNTDSKIIPTVRTNGVLLTQSTPKGGLISGTSSVMKMDGWNWEDAAYLIDDGVHLSWPRITSYKYDDETGISKSKNAEYDKQVSQLRTFFKSSQAYLNLTNPTESNLRFEAMRKVFTGVQNVYFHAESAREISDAILFSNEFEIKKTVLVGASECLKVTDLIKKYNVPIILGRTHSLPGQTDSDIDEPFVLPTKLKQAGVLYCLSNEGDMEVAGARNLPFNAGTTATYGLSKEEALMSITSNTAKILGVGERTGTIKVGMDANLFISTGDALDMRTNNVELAYIQGASIDLDNIQKQLNDKYSAKYKLDQK